VRYELRRTDDLEDVRKLHTILFPGDYYDLSGQCWVCHDDMGKPVAFCSARKIDGEKAVFLSRAGVLSVASGAGLQRRMIQARVRWAQEIGARDAITYVMFHNHPSIVNLLKSGFRFYTPSWKWAGDAHYFTRSLR